MFVELIATFVAGLAGAGLVMLINRVTGGRLPRWLTPVAAGAAMIATTIANEYSWFPRTRDTLPAGFVVAQTVESQAFYRPWTYVWPYVERFAAVDEAGVRTHPDQIGMRLAELYFFGRWSPVNKMPVAVDCVGKRRAALTDDVTFEDGGSIAGIDWVNATEADPVVSSVCGAT